MFLDRKKHPEVFARFQSLIILAIIFNVTPWFISSPSTQAKESAGTSGDKQESVGLTFFVGPAGNDTWSGRVAVVNKNRTDGPFATLSRAQVAVREVKRTPKASSAPITIMVREGTYYLSEPLVFEEPDGGTATCPITWCAYPGEKPVISGGRKVTGWTPYKDKILQADLPDTGPATWRVNTSGFWRIESGRLKRRIRQLFFNGQRQIRARTPNHDPADPIYGGWAFMEGPGDQYGATQEAFRYPPELLSGGLSRLSQAEVVFCNKWPGWGGYNPVDRIDPEKRLIYTTYRYDPYYHHLVGYSTNCRVRLENVLEALDQPGEWCLDDEVGKLYFWPPTESVKAADIVVPLLNNLIELRGARWITISGFRFTQTRFLSGAAVYFEHAEHVSVNQNIFDTVGGDAIALNGRSNLIQSNEIGYAGDNGIRLGEKVLNCRVVDNHIHRCGIFNKFGDGINQSGFFKDPLRGYPLSDGNLIAHNEIHDVPHRAISLGENPLGRNIVEYNDMRRTTLEMAEGGAINSWMDGIGGDVGISIHAKRKGHIIRYNRIVDVMGCGIEDGKIVTPIVWPMIAIYLDNMTSHCLVYGNIVVRAGIGVIVNPGEHNVTENNLFVDCDYQFCTNAPPQLWEVRDYNQDNRFVRNICYTSKPKALLFKLNMWTDKVFDQADHNLYYKTTGGGYVIERQKLCDGYEETVNQPIEKFSLDQWQTMGHDADSVVADPLFVDPANDDYRLKPESPALKLGFVPIDFSKIGIRNKQ